MSRFLVKKINKETMEIEYEKFKNIETARIFLNKEVLEYYNDLKDEKNIDFLHMSGIINSINELRDDTSCNLFASFTPFKLGDIEYIIEAYHYYYLNYSITAVKKEHPVFSLTGTDPYSIINKTIENIKMDYPLLSNRELPTKIDVYPEMIERTIIYLKRLKLIYKKMIKAIKKIENEKDTEKRDNMVFSINEKVGDWIVEFIKFKDE